MEIEQKIHKYFIIIYNRLRLRIVMFLLPYNEPSTATEGTGLPFCTAIGALPLALGSVASQTITSVTRVELILTLR